MNIQHLISECRVLLGDVQSTTYSDFELLDILNRGLVEVQASTSYYIDNILVYLDEREPIINLEEIALSIARVEYNNVVIPITSVEGMDDYHKAWRHSTSTSPLKVIVQYNRPSTFILYPRYKAEKVNQSINSYGCVTGIYEVSPINIIETLDITGVVTNIDIKNTIKVSYIRRFKRVESVKDSFEVTREFQSTLMNYVVFHALMSSGTSERISTASVFQMKYDADIAVLISLKSNNFRTADLQIAYKGFL